MDSSLNYHDEQNNINTLKMREVLDTLPSFCKQFFRASADTRSARTRLAYAYDLRVFFEFMHKNNSVCKTMEIKDFPLSILDQIGREDLEEFMEYVSYYKKDGETKAITNDEKGKKRKLSCLKSFYKYYYCAELIKTNPAELLTLPKIHEKEIIRLEPNEVATLLDNVEGGDKLTKKQKDFHNITSVRDLAIMTLLLGTGIRVSECVGIDIKDVDFDNGGIKIRRKGGYEAVVYFGDEVEGALVDYLAQRMKVTPEPGNENALFLSLQNKRISVRTVEKMVKKYAETVTTLKKITPHKLRSTYGTSLYRETGDIYLVADVLGHKDVNTTRKHYAAMGEEKRRKAANKVKLREE